MPLQDFSGSLEAIEKLLSDVPQDEVKLTVVKTGTYFLEYDSLLNFVLRLWYSH